MPPHLRASSQLFRAVTAEQTKSELYHFELLIGKGE